MKKLQELSERVDFSVLPLPLCEVCGEEDILTSINLDGERKEVCLLCRENIEDKDMEGAHA